MSLKTLWFGRPIWRRVVAREPSISRIPPAALSSRACTRAQKFFPHAFSHDTPVSVPLHFERGARDLRPGFAVYSLRFKPAMIDARRDGGQFHSLIGHGRLHRSRANISSLIAGS